MIVWRIFVLMVALSTSRTTSLLGAILAAIVMLITGFFFAAVSGNLVGMIGSRTTRSRA